jgi:hypothetical protein
MHSTTFGTYLVEGEGGKLSKIKVTELKVWEMVNFAPAFQVWGCLMPSSGAVYALNALLRSGASKFSNSVEPLAFCNEIGGSCNV